MELARAILDQQQRACYMAHGVVVSVSGDYSSGFPLVQRDGSSGQVRVTNISNWTLVAGNRITLLVQPGEIVVVGRHP
jgi:hypothetical protein